MARRSDKRVRVRPAFKYALAFVLGIGVTCGAAYVWYWAIDETWVLMRVSNLMQIIARAHACSFM